jgi:hypothetical protein
MLDGSFSYINLLTQRDGYSQVVSNCCIRPYAILFQYCSSSTVNVMAWRVDSSLRGYYDASPGKYTISDVWKDISASAFIAKRSKSWDCLVVQTLQVVMAFLTLKVKTLPYLETSVKIYQ